MQLHLLIYVPVTFHVHKSNSVGWAHETIFLVAIWTKFGAITLLTLNSEDIKTQDAQLHLLIFISMKFQDLKILHIKVLAECATRTSGWTDWHPHKWILKWLSLCSFSHLKEFIATQKKRNEQNQKRFTVTYCSHSNLSIYYLTVR